MPHADWTTIAVEHDGPVATITLRRPDKKNALSIALRDEVSDALDELTARTETRVVILTGEGDVFCAGFDLGEFGDPSAEHQQRLWASSDRFHHTVMRCPLPTIAAVNGPALAGGFDLACLCDIRIAATTARFAHPEQRWTTVLYKILSDLVGGATARDIVLTGRSVDAAEALRIELVVDVVAPDELMQAAHARAVMIAAAPRQELMRTKAKMVAAIGIAPDTPTLDF
jgi:enoyl-CoA hydratase/carnithine racemase